jgi:UDP-N-acetylglucosamine 2-epimerase
MKIVTIIGARPQFIKAAAISRAITVHNRDNSESVIEEILIHTGQHYDDGMSAIFFRELEIPEPKYNLGIGSGSHGKQTGQMLAVIEEVLLKENPDWVLIYGDTNSTLAGALAAAKLHIPIAHVEAGLRSFNRRMPEEINRIVADHLSTLLFCPSQVAVDNLAAESIGKNEGKRPFFLEKKWGAVPVFSARVVLTGDVMADALQFAATKAEAQSDILARLGMQPQSYLLATVHRAENTNDPDRLGNIMAALSEIGREEAVVLPLHPRTKKILIDHVPSLLPPNPSLRIIDPVGYFDIIALEKSARMILTDSGGMQKEAYWLKVPCITLRDETEWVETVEYGWNILTGADTHKIMDSVKKFWPPADHPPLYGDGQAAAHCLKALICHSRESGTP